MSSWLMNQYFYCRRLTEPLLAPRTMNSATQFDPGRHLAVKKLPRVLKMEELGYDKNAGVSPVAVSEAFQLFTPDAIQIMRAEIQKSEIHDNFSFSSNIATCQLRGYAKRHAPFTYEAWNHPETLEFLSRIADVEIVPVMDYEIGHINLSTLMEAKAKNQPEANNRSKSNATNEHLQSSLEEDDKPIVGWHTDSYPFVCVLMMSDCTGMMGGETALKKADGSILKVRGPTEGCAVILQGRYISHQALRARGTQERITSVTSFRPKSAWARDDSVLQTVRPVSDLSELYYGFAEYRLKMMEERIRAEREKLMAHHASGGAMDTLGHKRFLEDVIRLASQTQGELVEECKVQKGHIQ